MEEIWKDIKGYENLYRVSNFGNVLSLSRKAKNKNGYRNTPEKILKQSLESSGYPSICLSKDGKDKTFKVHQLVATAFLNHKPNGCNMVVNHINFIRTDNRLDNLEIISARENNNKKHLPNQSSKYVGVYWYKAGGTWAAQITINRKNKYLGRYKTELEAHDAYQKELSIINQSRL